MTAPEDEDRVEMWRECADDLRRWARAFTDAIAGDAALARTLRQLADDLEQRVTGAADERR